MSRPRAHISLTTKLASALLARGDVPYDDAKLITAEQMCSLYTYDHGMLHAFDGPDEFWNLTPRLIVAHREKSKRDKAITSKAARIDKHHEEFRRRLLAKDRGEPRPTSRMGVRKLQSRNDLKRRPRRDRVSR